MQEEQTKTIALLCPLGIWEFLRETLDMDSRSTAITRDLLKQIMQALAQVDYPETNNPLFAFRIHSISVKTREAMFQTISRLSAGKSLLVCVGPIPDVEYLIFVQEEQAQSLETAAHAGDPTSQSVPRPDPTPDAFLKQEYEDRVSGVGQFE